MKFIFLLGRILFSSIFIIKGFEHFSTETMLHAASVGVPMVHFVVPIAGIIALLGGFSILFGYKARLGAWLLVIFLLPTAIIMHNFWQEQPPFEAMMHNYCFWKNLSLLGAALMISYFGSGPMSFDRK